MARVDLHLHSRASTKTGNWFLKNALLPESYSPPEDVYCKAKRMGMTFVTLTDHDTIDGALEIAHHPDVFLSVEATTRFPEDGTPLHVLCWNIDETDFAVIDAARDCVYDLVDELERREIVHALAHPLQRIGATLTPDHIERCLLLFPIWEGRNGARNREGNEIAVRISDAATPEYLDKLAERHGIAPRRPELRALTAGSDDHGLLDAASTYTETPDAASPGELLQRVSQGETTLRGQHGSIDALAYTMIGLAIKASSERGYCPIPGELRGLIGGAFEHELPPAPPTETAAGDGDLAKRIRGDKQVRTAWRRAGRLPEGPERSRAKLRIAAVWAQRELMATAVERNADLLAIDGIGGRIGMLLGSAVLALPHLASAGYHAAEADFARSIGDAFFGETEHASGSVPRTVMLTDTFRELNGVAGTMRRLADRAPALSLPITVVTHGHRADRRAGLVTLEPLVRLPIPAYADDALAMGIPSLIDVLDVIDRERAELIHATTPGPLGLAGLLIARLLGLPFVISHTTQMARYTLALTGDRLAAEAMREATLWIYRRADAVFAPTEFVADRLAMEGVPAERIRVFGRGVDTRNFTPERRSWLARRNVAGNRHGVVILVVSRVSDEKGIDRLIDAVGILEAEGLPVRLSIVGDGPARARIAARLDGTPHRMVGPLERDALGAAYASADIFCLPSLTETLGQVVLEAQASGLPVVIPQGTAPAEQIVPDVSGFLAASGEASDLADALRPLVVDRDLRRQMGRDARTAMLARPTWDEVFTRLGDDYRDLRDTGALRERRRRDPVEMGVT